MAVIQDEQQEGESSFGAPSKTNEEESSNVVVIADDDDDDPADNEVHLFHDQGFLQLPCMLRASTCQTLRDFILQDLQKILDSTDQEEHERRFSNIRQRSHRWDLKLKDAPIVHQAMHEVLSHNNFLKSILAPLCECAPDEMEDLVLAELGSLISEPGAKNQEWHADTAHTGPLQPDCICCFITLQETPLSMGPTQLIPHTHLQDFHCSAMANFPPKGLMPASLEPKSMQNGYTAAGEALLMDCRLYHRGSANTHSADDDDDESTKDGRRVVFYFTVRSRRTPRPGGFLFTILEELNEMPLVDFLADRE